MEITTQSSKLAGRVYTDPDGKQFTVLDLGPPLPAAQGSSSILLLPQRYFMTRELGDVTFQGRILPVSTPEKYVDGSGLDFPPRLQFSVRALSQSGEIRVEVLSDPALDPQTEAGRVWCDAIVSTCPSLLPYARAAGGLGLFGLTTSAIQVQLAALSPPQHIDLLCA